MPDSAEAAMHVRPEGVLPFRSCSHCLTVFVMSLVILITIRIGRPVLIKKIAQSFADSLSTDPSPSDMCIDFVAKKDDELIMSESQTV